MAFACAACGRRRQGAQAAAVRLRAALSLRLQVPGFQNLGDLDDAVSVDVSGACWLLRFGENRG